MGDDDWFRPSSEIIKRLVCISWNSVYIRSGQSAQQLSSMCVYSTSHCIYIVIAYNIACYIVWLLKRRNWIDAVDECVLSNVSSPMNIGNQKFQTHFPCSTLENVGDYCVGWQFAIHFESVCIYTRWLGRPYSSVEQTAIFVVHCTVWSSSRLCDFQSQFKMYLKLDDARIPLDASCVSELFKHFEIV